MGVKKKKKSHSVALSSPRLHKGLSLISFLFWRLDKPTLLNQVTSTLEVGRKVPPLLGTLISFRSNSLLTERTLPFIGLNASTSRHIVSAYSTWISSSWPYRWCLRLTSVCLCCNESSAAHSSQRKDLIWSLPSYCAHHTHWGRVHKHDKATRVSLLRAIFMSVCGWSFLFKTLKPVFLCF